jgi:predicted nucleotidyltransferase
MSAQLHELADSLHVNERTLRRAWALGMLRGTRTTPYKLDLQVQERVYLRRQWPTLSRLRRALRTEPNVSMAVLFGSVARGDDTSESDVDLLVALRNPGLRQRVGLTERLRTGTGLDVEVVALEDALRRPSLMVEILRDGRVLIDRDRHWPQLCEQERPIGARAKRDRYGYNETLDALRRRFEQLEVAAAQFSPDLDEQALSAAWHSDDPLQRNRADSVLSSFEKTYMLLMDLVTLSVKLGRRLGTIEADQSLSPIDALSELQVLSQPARQALDAQREVRNYSQHVYVELTVAVLREAVKQQMKTTPFVITSIVSWVDSWAEAAAEQNA